MKKLVISFISFSIFSMNCNINERSLILGTLGNNTQKVKDSIKKGADVNTRDAIYGNTPLHWATAFGNKEIAKLLVDNGADTNAKDDNAFTPLHYAVNNNNKEMAKILINNSNVNAKNINGDTPLHVATQNDINYEDKQDIINLLLENGADAEATNNEGKTPADFVQLL